MKIKIDGGWEIVKKGYVKDAGIWKQFHDSFIPPPAIGELWESQGGYYMGEISTHYHVLAPKASESILRVKTTNTSTSETTSNTNGWDNTAAMDDSLHPAARHCLDYRGGGFDDWYLMARDELIECMTIVHPLSSSTPAIFKQGGGQDFDPGTYYWSSTQYFSFNSYRARIASTNPPDSSNANKTNTHTVRPFRRVPK